MSSPSPQRAASRALPKKVLVAYFVSHMQALLHSLGRLVKTPLASLMTIGVIGITLALPAGMHVLLQEFQGISAGWKNTTRISLFLRQDIDGAAVNDLFRRLQVMPGVASVVRITPDEALAEFRQLTGFGEALQALTENPLPFVLVVQPKTDFRDPLLVQTLLHRLRDLPGVELAQLDLAWLKRLFALTDIARRGVLVLGVLLSLAVLLIMGNTIRLAIQSRREEIEVEKLIGATDAFIRRPFLYSGCWYGLAGALVAWLLVNGTLWFLSAPIQRLSVLYNSDLSLAGLGIVESLVLLLTGVLLGTLGAWLAVGRHLREIEPG